MNACHEPISWLRLEHYHLGELPADEHSFVREHLEACPHCRAMLAEIEGDDRTLPPLPVPSAAPARPWYHRWSVLLPAVAGPLAVAAIALLLLRPPPQPGAPPPSRVAIKGGELAIALVRERAGVTERHPEIYLDGDRFQVLVTSPPGQLPFDLVVLQGGQAYFPIPAASTHGGNAVPVGSFVLTGPGDAAVCVVTGTERATREELAARGVESMGDGCACLELRRGTP
jgi:hypothetical protein